MPLVVLSTTAGLQEPVMPLSDVPGNAGADPPAQRLRLLPKAKVGVTIGLTVTVKVAVVAQRPAVGVKVYVPEVLLSTVAGLQVPVIPFEELVGSVGTDSPAQIVSVVPNVKVGVIFGLTVTLKLAGRAHCPASGVKV